MDRHEQVFRDQQITVHHFAHDVLVRCPSCGKCARVYSPNADEQPAAPRPWRLTCLHCGFNTERSSRCCRVIDNGTIDPVRDPVFRVPVWLQAPCCGGKLLWAYNLDHLAFLESFVAATMRERAGAVRSGSGYRRLSMIAKLPAWLKAAKHREEIMRTIARLHDSITTSAR